MRLFLQRQIWVEKIIVSSVFYEKNGLSIVDKMSHSPSVAGKHELQLL